MVDREETTKGVLPINRLIVTDPEVIVASVMNADFISFSPDDKAQKAAQASSVTIWCRRRWWTRGTGWQGA